MKKITRLTTLLSLLLVLTTGTTNVRAARKTRKQAPPRKKFWRKFQITPEGSTMLFMPMICLHWLIRR